MEAGRVKAQDTQKQLKAKRIADEGINFASYPENLKEFFEMFVKKFADSPLTDYKNLDRQIGDLLHQHYLTKLYPNQPEHEKKVRSLASDIFKILDETLQGKLVPNDAKNYKKLLAAI